MPSISFSVVEILPTLLFSHKKTQTIRPLFGTIKGKNMEELMDKIRWAKLQGWYIRHDKYWMEKRKVEVIKEPRLKPGDIATLYWKQRSKYKWFCKECGNMVRHIHHDLYVCDKCEDNRYSEETIFPKLLGKVKITEVFEIEMGIKLWYDELRYYIKREDGPYTLQVFYPNDGIKFSPSIKGGISLDDIEQIAKRDGFKSANDMFSWFDKKYDLSTPKRFALYRWRWLNGR